MSSPASLVTGASRGIGLSVARRLRALGHRVMLAARNASELEAAKRSLLEFAGPEVETFVVDVGRAEESAALVADVAQRFGRLDVLVNNAGIAPRGFVREMSDEAFEQLLATNVRGVFAMSRAAWPLLAATRGVIVNLSSMSSVDPFPGMGLYGATKAWVNLASQAMAAEGKEAGIRVFAVAPGTVETSLMRGLWPELPASMAMDPDEVAGVIEALIDPKMSRVSGQTIFVRS
ncbi:MAG: SDR family oxidoreductase [Deltaproteobacteria bacterium]|nr:SDR family oxidoreductase [Deltaproteobacteria bacterium]